MSNSQIPVVNQAQAASSSQCLTGCLYQLVQSPGPQGRNVFNLIPLLKSKDNCVPVVAAPTIPNARTVNIQQPVRFALPSALPNVSSPCQVNSPLVQQLGTGKYIITTQQSPVDMSKTIRVNGTITPPQATAVVLENSGLNLPATSKTGTQTILMMNTKSPSVPVKTVPLLPSGHGLQIPAHAEVKTVPASSLPFSIQQRILPQLNCNDNTKIPSVIYVSPVNTVKTSSNNTPAVTPKPNLSLAPIVKHIPVLQTLASTLPSSKTESPKGPMKWVVQENKESAACIVPVTSSNNTASKLLKMMSGTKPEDISLSNASTSKMVQIKDNALVVCNNKIYLLTKQGAELRGTDNMNPEPSNKTSAQVEQNKDPQITSTEAVLSKSVSSPPPVQTVSPGQTAFSPCADITEKSRTCTPSKANGKESEVIYIDDDDDDDVVECVQKPQAPAYYWREKTSFIKPDTPPTPLVSGINKNVDHVQIHQNKASSVTRCTPSEPLGFGSRKDDLLYNQPVKTGSINVCNTPANVTPTKDDHIPSRPDRTSSMNTYTPSAQLDLGSKRKDDLLNNQPNKISSINVCSVAKAPAMVSKTKDDIHSQPNKTSSVTTYTPSAQLDFGSDRKDDLLHNWSNKTSSMNILNATTAPFNGLHTKDDHIHSLPNKTSSIQVCSPAAPSDCGIKRKSDKVDAKEEDSMEKRAKDPVRNATDDQSLRVKFGLLKKEMIILSRIPLLQPESTSNSRRLSSGSYLREDFQAPAEILDKRKLPISEMDQSLKRRKINDIDLNQNTLESNYSLPSSSTTMPVPASSSYATSGQRQCSSPVLNETETYTDPAGSDLYYFGQDTTGHFSEVSFPRQRFFVESSAYPDETTKDEKIQRLKEVLKEREQALEALRRLKRP